MEHSLRVTRAREQRQLMSHAEGRLWYNLRAHRFGGHKFRRQFPIGPFFADFVCVSARLVIETDGQQHGTLDQQLRDQRRTEWLEARGWRVLRFWTYQLVANLDGVLETIYKALEEPNGSVGPSP